MPWRDIRGKVKAKLTALINSKGSVSEETVKSDDIAEARAKAEQAATELLEMETGEKLKAARKQAKKKLCKTKNAEWACLLLRKFWIYIFELSYSFNMPFAF